MNKLPKTYDPLKAEKKWYRIWQDGGYFKPRRAKESYTVIMPPPNVTGMLHAGHALNITIQDSLVRYKRMKGFETLYIPGMDHAGIATQAVVERQIYQQEKKTRYDLGRDEFLKRVWDWKKHHGGIIDEQQKQMGLSADWDYFLFTMDEEANEAVRRAFIDYYNEGLIYRANRMINWDPVLQSAISDAEVEYKEIKGFFYHIYYQLKDSEKHVEIATTRPETLLGDTAVSVNPKDDRFKDLIGEKAIVPLCGREVPIIADCHVDMEMGTGALKVTPGHDFNDFEIGKRHNLPVINILNPDGTLNKNALQFSGLEIKDARLKIIEELKKNKQIGTIKEHIHQVGHGQRSGHPVEPIVSKQWFLNVKKMGEMAVEKVKSKKTRFYPEYWQNTYFSWLGELKDWCISRQLWWGHRIPFFYCGDCDHGWPSMEKPDRCAKCESSNVRQDPDVLDTWFSSGLWPLSTLGWPDKERMKKKGFDRFFPTSVLVTGFDIIFFWVARMMMMSLKSTGKIPFEKVYIHAIVRDKSGRKMSKSLGNGIDPLEMVKLYGADAFRFTLAVGSGYNRTLNLDPAKIEGYRNYINKIWNAFRFIYPYLQEHKTSPLKKEELSHHERWIVSELAMATQTINKSLDQFRFDEAASTIYTFTYDKFCSWFIEISKQVLSGKDSAVRQRRIDVLSFCFKEMLKLLHPITPFISEELWNYLKKENEDLLIVQKYPQFGEDMIHRSDQEKMARFAETVTAIRHLRAKLDIKPKEEIQVCLFSDNTSLLSYFAENKDVFLSLARVKTVHIYKKNEKRPSKAVMTASGHTEIHILLEGVIDFAEQRKRLQKQLNKVQKEYEKGENKLSNPNFRKNAPSEIIQKTKEKISSCQEKIDSIKSILKQLGS